MSREKQIKDMVADIEQTGMLDTTSRCEIVAKELYNAGYRKDTVPVGDILSDLKKEIHNRAVFANIKGVDPYVTLKMIDAVINGFIKKYGEKR